MNRLNTEKRAQILSCLVEGNSIRSTVRITGAAKNSDSGRNLQPLHWEANREKGDKANR